MRDNRADIMERLARREAELSRAQRIARIGSYEVECRDGKFYNRRSPEYLSIHGLAPQDWNEPHDAWVQRMHPDDRGWAEAAFKKAVLDGATEYEAEYRIIRPNDGELRWVKVLAEIDRDQNGQPLRLFGTHIDITERKRAEEELRESEERLRLTIEAAGIGTFSVDVATGIARYSPELSAMLGFPRVTSAHIDQAFARIHREDAARVRRLYEAAHDPAGDGRLCMELRFVRPGGEVRWMTWNGKVEFRDSEHRRIPVRVLGACADITERKEAEERLHLLLREVNHRSKNMLALVQTIARQTAASGADFVKRFEQRVRALAANQDLLVKSAWKGVYLDELIHSQLAHFEDLLGRRIRIMGPPLTVSAKASETLGMAVHELATNAGKYGSLSTETGTVTVAWDVREGSNGEPRLVLTWTEEGGPTPAAPERTGFGSTVIGRLVSLSLDGDVQLDFAPTGVVWRLECALEKLSDSPKAARLEPAPTARITGTAPRPRVLVVEDEALVAIELVTLLVEAGFDVVGPVGSVANALHLLDEAGCDAAVLDINLGSETAEPVAVRLAKAGIPFVTISGYAREQQPDAFRGGAFVPKPLHPGAIVAAVQKCIAQPAPAGSRHETAPERPTSR